MRHSMHRLALLLLALVSPLAASAGEQQSDPELKVIGARPGLVRVLGPALAKEVPAGLDLSKVRIVFLRQPLEEATEVEVVTLEADPVGHNGPHTIPLGPLESVYAERQGRRLVLTRWSDVGGPCSGGIEKPPEVMEECRAQLEAQLAAARKKVTLIAVSRAYASRFVLRHREVPPRP